MFKFYTDTSRTNNLETFKNSHLIKCLKFTRKRFEFSKLCFEDLKMFFKPICEILNIFSNYQKYTKSPKLLKWQSSIFSNLHNIPYNFLSSAFFTLNCFLDSQKFHHYSCKTSAKIDTRGRKSRDKLKLPVNVRISRPSIGTCDRDSKESARHNIFSSGKTSISR